MVETTKVCYICDNPCEYNYTMETGKNYHNCPLCGKYVISDYTITRFKGYFDKHKIACYLYHNNLKNKSPEPPYIPIKSSEEKEEEYTITEKAVENWYPKTFQQKVDMILLALAQKNKTEGEPIILNNNEIISLFFLKYNKTNTPQSLFNIQNSEVVMKNPSSGFMSIENVPQEPPPQGKFYKNYFEQNNLLEIKETRSETECSIAITILPEGYKIIYGLQKECSYNEVFIAMSFDNDYENIRKTIIEAIRETGYTEKIMLEHQTNEWIMPEIFHLIEQSKFVIVDLTSHNLGAYYESGFAEGIGKEVIHICQEKIFKKKSHFDVKQKATVLWNTEKELKERLIKRIEATIGKAKK